MKPYPLMLLHFFRDISAAQRIRILATLGAIPLDLKGGLNETIERRVFDSLVNADRADELRDELRKMIDEESSTEKKMIDIAKCVRIFDPDPSDDLVAKRKAAIKSLRTRFLKKRKVNSLMKLGSDVLGVFRDPPLCPQANIDVIEEAIKKESESFIREDRDLEMSVCTMAAVIQAIEVGGQAQDCLAVADVLGVAVWSGASFLPPNSEPKLEQLRLEVVSAARNRILRSSLETRQRFEVPDFDMSGHKTVTVGALKEATFTTVKALTYNAALDREELDLLWWVLAKTSQFLDQPLCKLSPESRAIATGLELGQLMRGLPTQSHRNLSLRGIAEVEPLTLEKLVKALGDDRHSLLSAVISDEEVIEEAPSVFPLINALRTGKSNLACADVKRSLQEWCNRALLESSVVRLQYLKSPAI